MTGVLALAAYSFAGAHGDRGPREFGGASLFQDGPGGAGGPGRGRGPRGGGMPGLRGIELTDDQKAQIEALRDAERGNRQGPPADAALHRGLQAELFADAPDQQKIAALQQQLAQAQTARLAQRIAFEQKVAQILTAEQRAQIRDRLSRGRRDPPTR
jgi:Spy/CpxP family protein refolding chaperone